jgi:hypothetical protein
MLPPIAVERLQNEEPEIRYPDHVQLMRAAWRIVSKHFQANIHAGVIAPMRKLRTINPSLNETAYHIRSVYPLLFRLLRTVSRVINDIKTTAPGATQLFEDGEMFFNQTVVGLKRASEKHSVRRAEDDTDLARPGARRAVDRELRPEVDCNWRSDVLKQLTNLSTTTASRAPPSRERPAREG